MLCGLMNVRFNWKRTRDLAVGSKENRLDQNQGKNQCIWNKCKQILYNYKQYLHELFTTCLYYKAKHPIKVHIWAGISKRGWMGICICEGIMDAPLYIQVLQQTLLPFLQQTYPVGHRFMADNDPKNTSNKAKAFVTANGINWCRTAESPDCNPIENLWHELKEYNRRVVKPANKQQLIDGIQQFWETVSGKIP